MSTEDTTSAAFTKLDEQCGALRARLDAARGELQSRQDARAKAVATRRSALARAELDGTSPPSRVAVAAAEAAVSDAEELVAGLEEAVRECELQRRDAQRAMLREQAATKRAAVEDLAQRIAERDQELKTLTADRDQLWAEWRREFDAAEALEGKAQRA